MDDIGKCLANDMIGLTVGINGYRSRAEFAARQFAWATGLPVRIVTDDDLPALLQIAQRFDSHIPPASIPFFAKILAFSLVDAQRIVYFDADLIHLNRWSPASLDANLFHVVRDLWWSPAIQEDCKNFGIYARAYFNCGFFVLNKDLHEGLAEEVVGNWEPTNSAFQDQTWINRAVKRLGFKLNWLHRDHNMLAASRTCELGVFASIAAHLSGDFPADEYPEFIRKYQETGIDCIRSTENHAAIGRWSYERENEIRTLELLPDGTIGEGTDYCERFWRVWKDDELKLAIFGNPGNDSQLSETFHATFDGTTWSGRWNRFEQDDIRLQPLKSARQQTPPYARISFPATVDFHPLHSVDQRHLQWLYNLLLMHPFRKTLEVGCLYGASSHAFVQAINDGAGIEEAHFVDVTVTSQLRQVLRDCTYRDRMHLHEAPSPSVIKNHGPFDFVFLDGDHRLSNTRHELELLLEQDTLCIMAHDTSGQIAGITGVEGTAWLKRKLQAEAPYLCLEDNAVRPGERTHRGMFLAARCPKVFAAARESFRAWH